MKRLFRSIAALAMGLAALAGPAAAQNAVTVSGRVTSDAGTPLQGASVVIPALNLGGYSQADGRYTITVPATRATGQSVTVSARRIGFTQKSITLTLSGSITQDFVLSATATQLEGIVVTALGIEKEKSQLGTAQQTVNTDELNRTHEQSVVNQLAGKVSGVQITQSGTQGGSSKISIRGSNSVTGSNQPLFILDGIAVSNQDRGGASSSYGAAGDYGSAISDLNPEDIESMSVLKGPNAAALYGSRAANGVVIITTKKGRATQGRITTEGTAGVTWDTPSILPTYQNRYGQGSGGEFMYVDGAGSGVCDGCDQSYGPKLDGRTHGCTFEAGTTTYDQSAPCLQFTSPNAASPWISHPDNVKSFFNTGKTMTSNLAVSGGTDRANARLSVGADNVAGFIPNNFFQKISSSLTGTLQANDRLSATGTLQYIGNEGRNRPGVGYNAGILEQFIWFGRQVDMNALRNYYDKNGQQFNWNYNYHNNPFWMQYENPERDHRDRYIGVVSATYKLADGVNATLRSGSDIYRYHVENDWAQGNLNWADPSYFGAFRFYDDYRNENNTDLLVTANRQLMSKLSASATVGGNQRLEKFLNTSVSTAGISVPGIYNVSNAAITPTLGETISRRQVNSAYGAASFTWDGWFTVEGTARNDISSTLPKGNNSYFYPSGNTSLVLTDAIPALKNRVLTYAKLRASIAQVGNDADPYQLATTFVGQSTKFGSLPRYSLSDKIANANLKPEITKSSEAGLELGFFGERASLDLTYYSKATSNQIIPLTVSNASGFSQTVVNAGLVTNKGLEAFLTAVPFRVHDAEWTSTFNFSLNRSHVVSLAQGLKTYVLGGTWNLNVEAKAGDKYGTLFGAPLLRDSTTHKLITRNGLPLAGPRQVVGHVEPDWVGGWTNTLKYRDFSLSGLVDMHVGGQIFSVSNMFGVNAGVFAESMKGREVDWDKPGVVVQGLDLATCASSAAGLKGNCQGGQPNTRNRTAEDYWQSLFQIHEPFIYRNTWFKLRELRLGWDVPPRYTHRLYAQSLNVGIVGRNLYTWKNVPNIDPEFTYDNGNVQGLEFAPVPNPRSIGFNIRVTP